MELLDFIMKYLVVPLAVFVYRLETKHQEHHTTLEVLKAQVVSDKNSHERENGEMRETLRAIFSKLDSIEGALRK